MSYVNPTNESIADLLEIIFGENIAVSAGDTADFADQHVATFVDPEDKLVAICACDEPFVAYSGAALSLIPADVANEMIAGGDLTEAVAANFYEVMNICSKLMMSDKSPHLRLQDVIPPGDSATQTAAAIQNGTMLGFNVDIPRYGSGALNFLIS